MRDLCKVKMLQQRFYGAHIGLSLLPAMLALSFATTQSLCAKPLAKTPATKSSTSSSSSSSSSSPTSASMKVQTLLSEANCELYSPSFAGNDKVLVVKKLHEPDGHEAEMISPKVLEAVHKKGKANPRSCDPCVTLLSIDMRKQEFIDFGWSPVATPSGDQVIYSHQQKPITGYRVLADTQKGNQIMAYSVTKRTKDAIAIPPTGYYDAPMLAPDGRRLAYQICDATNGAWGGQVGIGIYDLATQQNKVVMPPRKHFELFDLVGDMFWSGNDLIAKRSVACDQGMYLANNYQFDVLDVTGGLKSIWKSDSPKECGFYHVKPAAAERISIIGNNSDAVITKKGQLVSRKKFVDNGQSYDVLSPDGKFGAVCDKNTLTITNKTTGKKHKQKLSGAGRNESLVWKQENGKTQLLVVATQGDVEEGGMFERDVLLLVEVLGK